MKQQTTQIQHLTPIQQLQLDKEKINARCNIQEKQLKQDVLFIQKNAGNLLLSGLSGLLFPKTNKSDFISNKEKNGIVSSEKTQTTSVSFSDYLSLIPRLIPIVWNVTKPILTAWGIKKMQHWLINQLFRKKKRMVNN